VYAFVHARGGGENGVAWHEAARKTTKQRTIDDVIAAARWLVANGYTSPKHLAVVGKSAGGIPAGGALTQAPELFGAALLRVAVTDLLRIELSGGGPANTAEYGSVTREDEFRVLHAISPYANVRDGVRYPAVMLETGANDPRVPPWQLAKMAARLQAASASHRPVLLRVDYDAGHGLGSDRRQQAELLADEYAFLTWQLR
jgi:prolyl oligopeptidase